MATLISKKWLRSYTASVGFLYLIHINAHELGPILRKVNFPRGKMLFEQCYLSNFPRVISGIILPSCVGFFFVAHLLLPFFLT